MNYSKIRNLMWLLIVGAFLLSIVTSRGAEFWLRSGTNTVTMPDGRLVTMWGFAQDSSAGAGDGVITVPGPQLSVVAGDSLIIHLQNTLPEPVSIFVPGQYSFDSMDPAFHGGGAYEGRVRSLTREAAAAGGTATYSWANVQAGTFLYHSGSHPSVQVQMGLYGALTVAAPGPQVYAGVPFDSSVTLLFSEIDPAVHDAVAAGQYGPGPQFLAGDFTASNSLINSLSAGAPGSVAAFVWNQIPAADQTLLMDTQQSLQNRIATLVSDLNTILIGPCIYNPNLFPDGNLSPATLALLMDAPTINYPQSGVAFNGNMVRLNRLLLQDGLAKAGIILQPVNKMTSTIRSYPQYFLVNGQPYTLGQLPINAGAAGSTILLRLLNAGMDAHVPTLNNGGDLQLISEDGQQSPYPRYSSVVFMPALKTIDALWTPPSTGTYAVYDRRLGLVNGTQSPGGMLAYLSVGAPGSLPAPTILIPPASQSVFIGQSATFSVVATHRGTLSYQWQKNVTDIPDATNATFTISSATTNDAASYRVVVTDTVDTVSAATTSASATLTVYELPTIATLPVSQIVFAGSPATFSVVVTNGGTLSYQWQKDGSPIAGATNSAYVIPSTGLTNAGSYQVVVTGTVGMGSASVTSAAATLSVVTQPNPVTVVDGGLATFSVTAAGSATLGYQWQRDGVAIGGATNSSYSFTASYVTDNGHSYSLVVDGLGGQITSADALLTVTLISPTITTAPASQTVFAGSPVTFNVVATHGGIVSYQWKKNGSAIAGATNSAYAIPSAGLTNAGGYQAVVTDTVGTGSASTTSAAASLSVVTQPNAVTVIDGGLAIFSVTASSSATLGYQWRRDGVAIGGATNSSYSFTASYVTDNGHSYSVVVDGPGGQITSANALLTVTPIPLSIITQPASQTVPDFGTATFTAATEGTALTYQWQRRSGTSFSSITNATASSYSFDVRRPTDNGAVFRVVVNGPLGQQVTSSNAVLTVTPVGPQIVTQPANVTVSAGQSTSLTVVARATGTLGYQWQKLNGNNWVNVTAGGGVSGATSATLAFNANATGNPANASGYQVMVTSTGAGAGTVTSATATLTIRVIPPTITTPPASQVVFAGSPGTFSVVATHAGTLSYQWRKNGSPIAGATRSTYSISSAALTNAGNYQVVVTDTFGTGSASTTSADAALGVVTQPGPVTVVDGGLATFSVTAAGSATLNYQWRRDGVAIGGATSSSYSFTASYVTDNGHSYSVVANGTGGSATSANALLTVTPLPVSITTQPASQTVPDFGTATFRVATKGTVLTYQWQRRSGTSFSPINGATASSYSFDVRRPTDNGAVFRVVVGGALGQRVTSSNAALTVTPVGPQILTQPANATVNVGESTSLTVVARATETLGYQWQKLSGNNWVNVPAGGGISGATSATLAFNANATGNPANASSYRVMVTSTGAGAGSVTSATATLTINVISPTITTAPASQTVFAGSPVTFNVVATGSAPLSYQWQRNGVNLPGASARNSTLKIASASEVGNYTVVVTNLSCAVTSAPVALNLRQVFNVNFSKGTSMAVPIDGGTGGTVTNGIIVGGFARPYPSTNTIPAMKGTLKSVTITLKGLSHPRPNDVQALLVSPGGASSKSVLFMSGIGPSGITSDSSRVSKTELTFDDAAQTPAPSTKLTSGTYKPTKNKLVSEFPTGSSVTPPTKAGFGTAMSNFNNLSPSGDWLLYIVDDTAGPTKRFFGGGNLTATEQRGSMDAWSLTVTVGP